MTPLAIMLDHRDEVATTLSALGAGDAAAVADAGGRTVCTVVAREAIPVFHKIALRDLPAGTPVHKYGAVIGQLDAFVPAGGLVHVHNLKSLKAGAR